MENLGLYKTEEKKRKKLLREETVTICRLAILTAVLILLVMVLDSMAYGVSFSAFMFTLVYASLFGLITGLTFSACSLIRSRRSLPFTRTAVAALLCMGVPVVVFAFGIAGILLGWNPILR